MRPGIDYTGIAIAFLCHDGDGSFLLHKRSQACRDERGRWDFGGGQVEFSEDLETAVRREIAEEYGCKAVIQKQLPPISVVRKQSNKMTHWVSIAYIVEVDKTQVKKNDPVAIDQLGWFPLDDLPKPLSSVHRLRWSRQGNEIKRALREIYTLGE